MGLREFRAWCDQLAYEQQKERRSKDSWRSAENDPGWKAMRDKRDRARGR